MTADRPSFASVDCPRPATPIARSAASVAVEVVRGEESSRTRRPLSSSRRWHRRRRGLPWNHFSADDHEALVRPVHDVDRAAVVRQVAGNADREVVVDVRRGLRLESKFAGSERVAECSLRRPSGSCEDRVLAHEVRSRRVRPAAPSRRSSDHRAGASSRDRRSFSNGDPIARSSKRPSPFEVAARERVTEPVTGVRCCPRSRPILRDRLVRPKTPVTRRSPVEDLDDAGVLPAVDVFTGDADREVGPPARRPVLEVAGRE